MFGIIIVVDLLAGPIVALNPEMIVSLGGKRAVPVIGLQDSLGKGDAGGNTNPGHLLHSQVGIGFNIVLSRQFLLALPHQRKLHENL